MTILLAELQPAVLKTFIMLTSILLSYLGALYQSLTTLVATQSVKLN